MKKNRLYEKHKGQTYTDHHRSGIVCGYDSIDGELIIAIVVGHGWTDMFDSDIVLTHQNNIRGYRYVVDAEIKDLR